MTLCVTMTLSPSHTHPQKDTLGQLGRKKGTETQRNKRHYNISKSLPPSQPIIRLELWGMYKPLIQKQEHQRNGIIISRQLSWIRGTFDFFFSLEMVEYNNRSMSESPGLSRPALHFTGEKTKTQRW